MVAPRDGGDHFGGGRGDDGRGGGRGGRPIEVEEVGAGDEVTRPLAVGALAIAENLLPNSRTARSSGTEVKGVSSLDLGE